MNFYTSFEKYKSELLVRGVEDGRRVNLRVPLRPYFFVPSKAPTEFKTIHGKYVAKLEFDDVWEAMKYKKKWENVHGFEFYGMNQHEYPYINDTYQGNIEYDPTKIVIANIDLECKSEGGFPQADKAEHEITAITLNVGKWYHVFGCHPFRNDDPDHVIYYKCKNELDLLTKFIEVWDRIRPDVVTGWNITTFDVPYIVNRIMRVLGNDWAKRLSPWQIIEETQIRSMNHDYQTYNIYGVAVLDYLILYKKFSFSPQESYSLNHIAYAELGEKKLDYSEYGNLNKLFVENYQLFIEYNIKDTNLVNRLEEKCGFLKQVFAMAYDAKIKFTDTLATTRMWDCIIHNKLISEGIVVPQKEDSASTTIVGGHVKEPKPGNYRWIVTYDFTSLYPKLIEQYNISPETFRGMVAGASIDGFFDRARDNSDVKEKDYSIAANGSTYHRKFKGFLPQLMAEKFAQRDAFKKKMIEAKKLFEQTKDPQYENIISINQNRQMATKILINSGYGAFANQYFRWFDNRLAEAITSSGQLAIRWVERAVNDFVNQELGTNGIDYIIYADTDSIYVGLEDMIKSKPELVTMDDKINFIDNYAKTQIGDVIQKATDDLKDYMNAYMNAMQMKRENIADAGVWTGKKKYFLNVWDSEGVRYKEPKIKITGLEAIRSSTPEIIRKYIKQAIPLMIDGDETRFHEFIAKCKAEFFASPFEVVASPRGVNGMDKYHDRDLIYTKGTPFHVRGSLLYNKLLDEKKLGDRYIKIGNSDKIKYCYLVLPNPLNENVIAGPGILPRELGLDQYIDYKLQFDKVFIEPILRICSTFGWNVEKKSTLDDFWS